jgi:hypothetical protein
VANDSGADYSCAARSPGERVGPEVTLPRPALSATLGNSDMNIIYKGMCDECKAEVTIILRRIPTLENLRAQLKRQCMMCEKSEVLLEMQGFRGDTA